MVNNNAAATLLILTGLATGREVVISRGELVEIGGGFRVPDVMRQSGALLREVGTTNRTRVNDYTAAVSPATAMFLRVHPSNFRIEGFTERPSLERSGGGRTRRSTCRWSKTSAAAASWTISPANRRCKRRSQLASIWSASAATSCSADLRPASSPDGSELVDRLRDASADARVRVDKITFAILEATLAEYPAGRAADDRARAANAARCRRKRSRSARSALGDRSRKPAGRWR